MPTENFRELSERLVACKHFKWMPGMLAIRSNGCEYRVCQVVFGDEEYPKGRIANGWGDWGCFNNATPDLTDPATLGCLLFLVREAWKDPAIATSDLVGYDGYNWVTIINTEHLDLQLPHTRHGVTYFCGETEAEALVVALEAANE